MDCKILMVGVALVLGCGSTDEGGGGPPVAVASTVEVVEGDGQVDTVGQLLPVAIKVLVTDTTGAISGSGAWTSPPGVPRPVPGQLVNFVPDAGSGSFFVGSVITSDSGLAVNYWTAGTTSGAHCAEARAIDQVSGLPITFARFCMEAVPGPRTQQGFTLDTLIVGGEASFLLPAFARDAYNNPVPVPAPTLDTVLGSMAPDGGGWRITPNMAGWFKAVLGTDTLVGMVKLPVGWSRLIERHGDTTWIKRAKLTTVRRDTCNRYSSLPAPGFLYAGDSAATTRWVADTVEDGGWDVAFNGPGGDVCLVLPAGYQGWRAELSGIESILSNWNGVKSTAQIAPFTFILNTTGGVDTLRFGLTRAQAEASP